MIRLAATLTVTVLLAGGVAIAQEDPWPPLVTTCSVMPLLAADANRMAHDLLACASTPYPACEEINCQINNSDQLELELLPCWQHPAMWIKNRKLDGSTTFQDIFASSRTAQATIGGRQVKINVTAVQRDGLTLGFGLDILQSNGSAMTIFPYRDIPLNLTECPSGIPREYPLMCKMILYMEQFFISEVAGTQHDPLLTPTCQKPPSSCDSMHCDWTDSYGTKKSINFNFFRCTSPQYVRFLLIVGEEYFNLTFTESKIVKLNSTTNLNFTLHHPSSSTIGMAVSYIERDTVAVLIPYTVFPLDKRECSMNEKRTITNEKDHWFPLITTCNVMALLAQDANTNGPDLVKCTETTFPNCEAISCIVLPTSGQFVIKLLPCEKVPAIELEFKDTDGTVTFRDTFNSSRKVAVNIGKYVLNMSVTLIQGNGLTLGFGIIATMPIDHANITIFPYRQIPLNFTECPGAIPPNYPALCKMIDYMEQYIIASKSNSTHDPARDASCDKPPASCDLMTCYWKDEIGTKITHRYTFHPCSDPQEVGLMLEVGLHVYDMSFQESKMVSLNLTTTLNFTLLHPSASTVGVAVIFIVYGVNNVVLPYTVLPMDRNGCKPQLEINKKQLSSDKWLLPNVFSKGNVSFGKKALQSSQYSSSSQAISTCEVMSFLAMPLNAVRAPDRILNCSVPSSPNCDRLICEVLGTNDSLVLRVLPCSSPSPSLQLDVVNGTDDVIFQQTISKSMKVNVAFTNGLLVPVNFVIIKHGNHLTLGVKVEAELEENVTTTFIPYYEIPLNISQCPGLDAPGPTCAVMQNLAQYMTTYLTNLTRDTQDHWNCVLSKACTWLNCTMGKTLYYVISVSQCSKSVTFIKGYTNGTVILRKPFTGSGIYDISESEFFSVVLEYSSSRSGFSLELQVTVISRDINNSSMSVISPFIPHLDLPINITECVNNKTSSDPNTYLIDTCTVMPILAANATLASGGLFDCTSLSRPKCNKMICRETSSGDILTVEVLPCYRRASRISIVNLASDGKVTMQELVRSDVNYTTVATIGGQDAYFNITVVGHPVPLTLGVAISVNISTGNGYRMIDLIQYSEVPLDLSLCHNIGPVNPTATCRVMNNVAQYLNVYVTSKTHKNDGYCAATRESFCNSVMCKNSDFNSSYNMTFLPCATRIGYTTASGNATMRGYSFTVYSSSMLNYTSHIIGNLTLQQVDTTTVNFSLELIVDGWSIGYEIPPVTIPVDTRVCNTSAPERDPHALVSTCDIMPLVANSATSAAPSAINCVSFVFPNCNKASCRILSNNDSLMFELLPCYDPPQVRLSNTNTNGNVTFNQSFASSAYNVVAIIGGAVSKLNISVVQHTGQHSVGLQIESWFSVDGVYTTATLVPYHELPIDRSTCQPQFGQSNETATCEVMDDVAQYLTVFFADYNQQLATSNDACLVDHGPSALCNSVVCNLLVRNMFVSLAFRPCNNPVGLNFTYYSNRRGEDMYISRFIVRFAAFYIDTYTYANFTFFPLRNRVLFGMSLENHQQNVNTTFLEVPMTYIPLDTSVCDNSTIPDGHQNHTHPNNTQGHHNSSSIADICDIMPKIAREASKVDGNLSIDCTTPIGRCNRLQCFLTQGTAHQRQQELFIRILPCTIVPKLEATVGGRAGQRNARNFSAPGSLGMVINGVSAPIYFNIKQHASRLTLGLEVSIRVNSTHNVTVISYKEIPVECPTTDALSGACAALSNISQYMNVVLGNLTAQPADCSYTSQCSSVQCSLGMTTDALTFALQPCNLPPSVAAVVKSVNDAEVMFNGTITNQQSFLWSLFSQDASVTISLYHYNSSVIGLEMILYRDNLTTNPTELVPETVVPLESSDCSTQAPPHVVPRNTTFTTSCDIMPIVALSVLPLGWNDMTCSSSPPPNCSNITCSVASTRDSFVIEIRPCFYPPAIAMYNYANGVQVAHKIFGDTEALSFTIGGQTTLLTVEVYQHKSYLSLGFQAFVTSGGHLTTFIPYREVPVNRSQCSPAPSTPTCDVMNEVGQYITVFMANATNRPYKTPDCFAARDTFCNRITCRFAQTREEFNFTVNPCYNSFDNHQVTFDSTYYDGKVSVFKDTKSASSVIRFMNSADASLIFNNLDNGDTIQLKMTVTNGEYAGILIPMVTIPVDKKYCNVLPGVVTSSPPSGGTASGSSSGTQATKSGNTSLIIAITVGAGGIFLLVIVILIGILFIMLCKDKKLSSEPYSYRPLSNAEDAEGMDYSVERSYEERPADEGNYPAHEDLHRNQ